MTRTLQRHILERNARGLNNNQRWMLAEIADDINAMTETNDMTIAEVAEVLSLLVKILGEVGR
jgi:hypothetical protein